jgi:hypothetical protein
MPHRLLGHSHFQQVTDDFQGRFSLTLLDAFLFTKANLFKLLCNSHQFILVLRQTPCQCPHKFRSRRYSRSAA